MASAFPKGKLALLVVFVSLLLLSEPAMAADCSASNPCANNLCCSQYGYCGSTSEYCCSGCLSQCNCGGGSSGGSSSGSGQATYYDTYTPSACYGYDTSQFPSGNLIAAASSDLYDTGICGASYEITCKGAVSGSGGCTSSPTVTVKVVDRCPGCNSNSFDLSKEAFSKIADINKGRINISWRKV